MIRELAAESATVADKIFVHRVVGGRFDSAQRIMAIPRQHVATHAAIYTNASRRLQIPGARIVFTKWFVGENAGRTHVDQIS